MPSCTRSSNQRSYKGKSKKEQKQNQGDQKEVTPMEEGNSY
jgi:hypothetical protein